jgi:hypothetical protein
METPSTNVRIPPELETAARAADSELADATPSVLVRVALAVLAGLAVGEAIRSAKGVNGVPLPTDFPVKGERAAKPKLAARLT